MNYAWVHWPVEEVIAFSFALPRILAFFSILPVLNRQALPGILRIGVASSFAVFLVPNYIDPASAFQKSVWDVMLICFKEAVLGFALGFFTAIPLWAFEAMGAFVDNQRGASIAQTLNPLTGHDSSPLGDLFSQCALILMFITHGFTMVIAAMLDSYKIWPIFSFFPDFDVATPTFVLAQLDRLMRLAILFSAPVMFSMLLAEIGLALVSRFVPQLQVFFLAMPIKSGLAMFVFSVYAILLFDYASDEFRSQGPGALQQMAKFMR